MDPNREDPSFQEPEVSEERTSDDPPPAVDEIRNIRQITLSSEFVRKTIHLGSLSIPTVYYYVDKSTALWILGVACVVSLFIDIGRHYIPPLKRVIDKAFEPILREHERNAKQILLSGATWVFLSAFLCVLVFPKLITVTAFAVLIISDAASALFGRSFGKHKFFDKSLEGSLAFVVSAWVVVAVTPKAVGAPIEYIAGAIATVVGAIVEAASVRLRLDDNLSVPVSIGLVMWGILYLAAIKSPEWRSVYEAILAFQ